MELKLVRDKFLPELTLGKLFQDGVQVAHVCEDTWRGTEPKVHGKTAIPNGRYQVVITFSNRFQCRMPLLLDVPNFAGIRIHPGNTAADTEGCLLPGLQRLANGVGDSRAAYRPLFNAIDAELGRGKKVFITIEGQLK